MDYFTLTMKNFGSSLNELYENVVAVFCCYNFDEDSEQDYTPLITEVFNEGPYISDLHAAIENRDLAKFKELKNILCEDKYSNTLTSSFFINSSSREDEIVKFLLTETEIKETKYNKLKANVLSYFLNIESDAAWNGEVITLLLVQNELACKAFFERVSNLLFKHDISDNLLIDYLENTPVIKEFLIFGTGRNSNSPFPDIEETFLMRTVWSHRFKLAEWLVGQGAYMLPKDVYTFLWSHSFSDKLLIKCLKNAPDINEPFIAISDSDDEGQTLCQKEKSLLAEAVRYNHVELAEWLVSQGADVNRFIRHEDPDLFFVKLTGEEAAVEEAVKATL